MGKLRSILLPGMFLILLDTVFAEVKWTVMNKIDKFGDDLVLFCTTENYSMNSTEAKRWQSGHEQRLLAFNGVPAEEYASKYKMNIQPKGFSLIIRNTTEADFNVPYMCSYGFNISRSVVLKINDAFEVTENNTESNGNKVDIDNVIILGIVCGFVTICIVIFVFAILYRRKKIKILTQICSCCYGESHDSLPVDRNEDAVVPLVSSTQKNTVTSTTLDDLTIIDIHKTSSTRSHHGENANNGNNTPIRINGIEEPESGELASTDQNGHGTTSTIEPVYATSSSRHKEYKNDELDTFTSIRQNGKMPNDDANDGSVTLMQDLPADKLNSVLSCDPVEPTNERPKMNLLYEYIKRINSFTSDWSIDRPSALKMAKAGFFYRGNQTRVQCFDCGTQMYWQEGDDPCDEKFHNNCSHQQRENLQ